MQQVEIDPQAINDEHIIMTPSLMAEEYFCRLEPEEVHLVTNYDGELI